MNTSTPVVQRHKMSTSRNSTKSDKSNTMNESTLSSNKNTSAAEANTVNGSHGHNIIVANVKTEYTIFMPATSQAQVIVNGKFSVYEQFTGFK